MSHQLDRSCAITRRASRVTAAEAQGSLKGIRMEGRAPDPPGELGNLQVHVKVTCFSIFISEMYRGSFKKKKAVDLQLQILFRKNETGEKS